MSEKKSGKNNNQNQQQERIKRKCYACGEIHEKDQICPDILRTLAKIEKNNIRSNYWGNVFVQCYKKKKNFLQLICEICELTEVFMGNPFYYQNNNVPIQTKKLEIQHNINLINEYCSAFIGCKEEELFLGTSKLSEELYKILHIEMFNESEEMSDINSDDIFYIITMTCSINGFFTHLPSGMDYSTIFKRYTDNNGVDLKLEFEKTLQNNKITYNLYLRFPHFINNVHCWHMFLSTTGSSHWLIPLCTDTNGKLKDLYEENSTFDYDELLEELPCSEPKFTLWKKRILTACNNNLVRWTRQKLAHHGYAYKTIYKECDICLCVWNDNSSYSLTVTKNGMGYKFKCENTEEETRYRAMAKIHEAVHQSWENRSTLHFTNKMLSVSKTKHISHKDVIITSNTLACKSHSVTAYRGIVHILTPDFIEETYELYVSYCEDCGVYRAFSSDYEELLKHGKPLCKVFKSEKEYNQNKNNLYTYKSHSVLNTMGYTVKANSSLSTTERRNILLKAISNKLLTTDEIISFLNWLIVSRKGRSSYETAVDKWTSDMIFLKNYKSQNRKSMEVKTIRI